MSDNQATALWCARQLRKMDWQTRHLHLKAILDHRPSLHSKVIAVMGPDEILPGSCTGVQPSDGLIIGKDKQRSHQLTLDLFFRRAT